MKQYIKKIEDVRDGDWMQTYGCAPPSQITICGSRIRWDATPGGRGECNKNTFAILLASPDFSCWREVPDKPKAAQHPCNRVWSSDVRPAARWVHVPDEYTGDYASVKLWPAGEPEPLPDDVAAFLTDLLAADVPWSGMLRPSAQSLCKRYGIEQ